MRDLWFCFLWFIVSVMSEACRVLCRCRLFPVTLNIGVLGDSFSPVWSYLTVHSTSSIFFRTA